MTAMPALAAGTDRRRRGKAGPRRGLGAVRRHGPRFDGVPCAIWIASAAAAAAAAAAPRLPIAAMGLHAPPAWRSNTSHPQRHPTIACANRAAGSSWATALPRTRRRRPSLRIPAAPWPAGKGLPAHYGPDDRGERGEEGERVVLTSRPGSLACRRSGCIAARESPWQAKACMMSETGRCLHAFQDH